MLIAKIESTTALVVSTQISAVVFIALYDAETGQPTNGNNVVVSYRQNLNGVITDSQQTIAGQSAQIYYGLVSDTDPLNPFFAKFWVTDISAVPNPAPPVNVCDLLIHYVRVDQPESAPGAADGQITVAATSSYGPVQFSIDGGDTYQLSPTFSGLSSGLVNVTVIDANDIGCVEHSAVTVPTLASLLVSDPSVTLPGGNISRWNAAFNPVIFTYQRKDLEVTSVELDTATARCRVSINGNVLGVQPGDMVYLSTTAYSGVFKALSVYAPGVLVVDVPFTPNTTGYININRLRPYYQVRTRITYFDTLSGQQKTIISTNRPDNKGLVKADISNFLQSLLQAKDGNNFTQTNFRDLNLSASYQIAYAEYWDGKVAHDEDLQYIAIADPYYILYAAKQLGERYGGNLAEYVPFQSVVDAGQRAKWISDFTEPAYSNGYPFDIGFIYGDDLVGRDLYCELVMLDINRNPLPGGPEATALLNDDGSWLLNQDGSKLIIADQTMVNTPIPQQLGLNRLLVNAAFDTDVYYFTLTLKYDDEHNTHIITQTQTIRVDDAVDERSVYLRWIGLSGSGGITTVLFITRKFRWMCRTQLSLKNL